MRYWIAALCLGFGGLTLAEPPALHSGQEARYQALIEELRCLVCQNQNIAESNAPLAEDLRLQVAEMINAGRSDAEIKDYLVARYGDFVLYRPPFKPNTWLLWGGPFLLLVLGLVTAFRIFSGRRSETPDESVDQAALHKLLQGQSDQRNKS